MRLVACGLLAAVLIAAAPPPAGAQCGAVAGEGTAVRKALAAIALRCDCCRPPPGARIVPCARRVAGALLREGTLPRRCLRRVVRRALHACQRVACEPRCEDGSACDDGNPCTADACVDGRCRHECQCVGPRGGTSCCPGPAAECPPSPTGFRYFRTCGHPVCAVDGGPIPGVPACTTQREGASCTSPGEQCDPGIGCGVRLLCAARDPAPAGRCPISARTAKRDVSYLDANEVRRLHDDLMRLRLATFRYRREGASAPERLGFVIDDVGQSPAVAADGTLVDLYGYASMAVAGLQAQGREIDRLKRKLAVLRRACRPPDPAPE